MKDPSYVQNWVDNVVFRLHLQEDDQDYDSSHSFANIAQPLENAIHGAAGTMHPRSERTRTSPSDLARFRSLRDSEFVLLLTPVVFPKGYKSTSDNTDPFESLGREFSRYHERIRHVPYVPGVGLTETHAAFIQQAAAIVVVHAEPTKGPADTSLAQQLKFGKNVTTSVKGRIPLITVQFRGPDSLVLPFIYEKGYRATSHSELSIKRIARTLFTRQV